MKTKKRVGGFSLIEILISLLVVTLASLSIVSLQKMIGHQGRDNLVHGAVLKMSIEKMESVLQFQSMADVEALHEIIEKVIEPKTETDLNISWQVTEPDASEATDNHIRDIEIQIDWNDSYGNIKNYSYQQHINLRHLMTLTASDNSSVIIESIIESSEHLFFNEKEAYQIGAFVIYNSELFEATSAHLAGETIPRDMSNPTLVSEGWKSYGVVSNPALASNPDLAALF